MAAQPLASMNTMGTLIKRSTGFLFRAYQWDLSPKQAAALAGALEGWQKIREPGIAAELTYDQLHRITAVLSIAKSLDRRFNPVIAKQWLMQPNDGVLFCGRRPIDITVEGDLDELGAIENYVDALPSIQSWSFMYRSKLRPDITLQSCRDVIISHGIQAVRSIAEAFR